MATKTVRACLTALGVTPELFVGCVDVAEEFSKVKKVYFKAALTLHPDKGGDPADFRALQEAWESVRQLWDSSRINPAGFPYYFGGVGGADKASAPSGRTGPTPSWEWFADAAEEAIPSYRVELAKSGRSQCKAKGAACKHDDPFIIESEVRCGSIDPEAGTYARWHHLNCWRVPASIWLGLPNPDEVDREAFVEAVVQQQQVSFCGFSELPAEQQDQVVDYLMDKNNWARRTKLSKAAGAGAGAGAGACGEDAGAGAAGGAYDEIAPPPSKALATQGAAGSSFIVPRPGVNGAVANSLVSKTFVMTGVFPELGGGCGLDLGKARCRSMIEAFGGRVTSSVSGKTDYLVVGKEPGASKVGQARAKGVPTIDVMALKAVLEGASLDSAPAAHISGFSTGYHGNALRLTDAQAAALKVPAIKAPKAAKPKKAAPAKKAKVEEEEEEEAEEEEEEEDDEPPPPKKAKKAAAPKKKATPKKKAAPKPKKIKDAAAAVPKPRGKRARAE